MIEAATRDAWRELEHRLRPFIARRVASSTDVADVLQDVFLRIQRGLNGLRDEDRFGPWVYRVARSAIGDYQRARARHPVTDRVAPEEAVPGPDHEDLEVLEQALATCVANFVATLASPYREAITLTELQGLTQREAAELLGISLPALKSRVQRGREQLRAHFDACCEIALDVRGRVMSCDPRSAKDGGGRCAPTRSRCD